MNRLAVACLLALISASGFADQGAGAIHSDIDQSIWKPFKAAFENMDGVALNALYADEVLRVTPEGLDTSGLFKQTNKNRFQSNILNGDQIELDFWFDSRQTEAATSYDVGFYRVRITSTHGEVSSFYGQFHIVLKKIEGQWKIVQDWDTDEIGGRPLTAADFERQQPARF